MAAISSASVTITPPKPSSSRSSPVSTRREIVAGTVSIAGNTTCAVMIDRTPAPAAARNGTRSVSRRSFRDASTTGRVTWESVSVRP